ncbi:MAG: DUF4276 family protein, partial [Pontiellaceae bacterium]|nr:DUF4276 family protein [Pontiellaceae bacterium]
LFESTGAVFRVQAMTEIRIAAIVEGHGECDAVPVLVRRIALEIDPGFVPNVLRPLRVPATKLMKKEELDRSIEFAARKLQGRGGILILVDCDDGCPAREGPHLLSRARQVRPDVPIAVVLAKKEYEAWFLAAAESLRNKRSLPDTLVSPQHPEEIRGAKEWLSDKMPGGVRYSETSDQAALTKEFDMVAARRADSFDKCYREIHKMLSTLRQTVIN